MGPARGGHGHREGEDGGDQRGAHGEFHGRPQLLRQRLGDRLLQLVGVAQVAAEQPPEVGEVLDRQRAVQSVVVPDLLPLLGGDQGVGADDGVHGVAGHQLQDEEGAGGCAPHDQHRGAQPGAGAAQEDHRPSSTQAG